MIKNNEKKISLLHPLGLILFILRTLLVWFKRHSIPILLVTIIFSASMIVLWPKISVNLKAGEIGVIFRPLSGGVDTSNLASEGINFKYPWNSIVIYNTQVQKHEIKIEIITKDLLKSIVTLAFQYEINRDTAPLLHRYVGEKYLDKVIIPTVVSTARGQISSFSSEKAFSDEIFKLGKEITVQADTGIINNISPPGTSAIRLIKISQIEIIDIQFPPDVQKSIEEKITQRSKLEAYEYVIATELKEAERKAIEAKGIKDFQDIIQTGLTNNYLRWKGIDASSKLANSQNAKIVIFGQGTASLPIIMGDLEGSPIGKNLQKDLEKIKKMDESAKY
jgi:regulator of protease activity HflC (stomatin/prohibitin superfamily)